MNLLPVWFLGNYAIHPEVKLPRKNVELNKKRKKNKWLIDSHILPVRSWKIRALIFSFIYIFSFRTKDTYVSKFFMLEYLFWSSLKFFHKNTWSLFHKFLMHIISLQLYFSFSFYLLWTPQEFETIVKVDLNITYFRFDIP